MSAVRRVVAQSFVVAFLVAFLVSCGSDLGSTTKQPDPDGHAYDAIGATGFDLPATATVRLAFDGFTVHVSGVCSTMAGDYHIADGLLVVPSLTRTEVACGSPSSTAVSNTAVSNTTLDDRLAELLRSSPRIQLDNGVLTLSSAGAKLQLQETTAEADLPLQGTLWAVTGVGNGDTVSHDNSLQPATLRIHDGVVDVFAGCNTGSAVALVHDGAVTFSNLKLGKKSCPAPQLGLEFAVVLALNGTVDARIEGHSLVIANGQHSLVLEGSPA